MKFFWCLGLMIFLFLAGCSQETNKPIIKPAGPPASSSGWPQDSTCSPGCPPGGASW
ncbi:MAG: hypothetical protein PHW74_03300 [Desulfobacca sp.]|nr:hypothetical protein [Desulfobacca sp.]